MAYATKYLFKWESSNGTTREIQVQKDGYSGSVIQRRLGRAPVLKKQRNGTVFGTSLEFYAECAVDGEFAEFYTSDPKAYKVLLYTGSTLLWQGYVTPELYSEPDIAPPYDVQVIATDGIGELKLYDFAAQGVKTLRQMFTYLLGYTGLGTDVYLISSMKAGSSGAGALLEKTINLDYKVGDTCYEVLTYLLDTLHATITWWRGAWIVARETNVTFSSSKVRYYNTSGNSALLTGSVVTLGKMYTSDAWPVGQLTQKIDPAKKSVTIQAPWHVDDAFVNGPMATDTGWTKTNNASWNSTKKGYNLPDNGQTTDLATVSQSISMLGMRVPMDFVGKFCASLISGQMYNGVAGVAVDYVTSGNVTYHLGKDSEGNPTWVSGSSGNTDYDFQIRLTAVDTDDANAEALSFTIPALAVGTAYPAGILTVRIVGRSAIVFSASLDVVITKGYQDRLHIDNGARGEEGTVEIAIGRETSDIDYYKAFMQGLLLDSGSLITSFKDDNLTTATDFLSYISRDYARSFALPRIVRTGKVYLEDGVSYPPLVLSKGAVDYWLETFSWDMYEDELDISARSLPTATITVESEVIAEYGTGTASSSSSSGGGATPITPVPSVLPNPYALTFGNKSYDGSEPVTLTASDIGALTGITAAMVNAAYGFTLTGTAGQTYALATIASQASHGESAYQRTDWDNYFGIDSDGNVYVKKDGDNPRHFYSYGAVSAGGLSTGGGTSGIDLAAMWASLQNNDNESTYHNRKIHENHLPTISGTGITGTYSHTGSGDAIQTDLALSVNVATILGYTPVNPSSLGTMAYASTGDYLPLSAGSGKALTGKLYETNKYGDKIVLTTEGTGADAWCTIVYQAPGEPIWSVGSDHGIGKFVFWNGQANAQVVTIDYSGNITANSFVRKNGTSSQFLKADGGVDSTDYLSKAGGTISTTSYNPLVLNRTVSNASVALQFQLNSSAVCEIGYNITTSDLFYGTPNSGPFTIWHSGNDGASSGLDADLLDGQHGAYYATASSLNSYLPLSAGSTKPLTNDLYLGTNAICEVTNIDSLLYFDTQNSRIGIGATTPDCKLQVSQQTDWAWAGNFHSGTSSVWLAFQSGAGMMVRSTLNASTDYILSCQYGASSLSSAGTTAFYVRADGNVGIGTDAPVSLLEVTRSSTADETAYINNGYATNNFVGTLALLAPNVSVGAKPYLRIGKAISANNSGWLAFQYNSAGGTDNALLFGFDGSINPKLKIKADGSIDASGTITISDIGGAALQMKKGSNQVFYLGSGSASSVQGLEYGLLQLYHSGTEYIRLYTAGDCWINPTSGKVGIGTASPSYLLDVKTSDSSNQILNVENTYAANYFIATAALLTPNITAGGRPYLRIGKSISANNSAWMCFDYAGSGSTSNSIGFGFDGNVNMMLQLTASANLSCLGAITAGAASDARFKDNIAKMDSSACRDFIMALNPVTFRWNELATSYNPDYAGDDWGFIAQEVEPLAPKAIGTIYTDYKRLDQTKFIAPLVSVAQGHETRLETAERKLAEAERRIEVLEAENKRLRS